MSPELILVILLVLPVLALMVLRINAVLVFLSLCLGTVLAQNIGNDTLSFLEIAVPSIRDVGGNLVRLVIMLTPMILTMIFQIRTVHGATLFFNVLPALGVGVLTAVSVVPLLSFSLAAGIRDSQLWLYVQQFQVLAITIAALSCLFLIWLQRPRHAHSAHGHGKKHH